MLKKFALGIGIMGIIISSLALGLEAPSIVSQVNTLIWAINFTIATLSWS